MEPGLSNDLAFGEIQMPYDGESKYIEGGASSIRTPPFRSGQDGSEDVANWYTFDLLEAPRRFFDIRHF